MKLSVKTGPRQRIWERLINSKIQTRSYICFVLFRSRQAMFQRHSNSIVLLWEQLW